MLINLHNYKVNIFVGNKACRPGFTSDFCLWLLRIQLDKWAHSVHSKKSLNSSVRNLYFFIYYIFEYKLQGFKEKFDAAALLQAPGPTKDRVPISQQAHRNRGETAKSSIDSNPKTLNINTIN